MIEMIAAPPADREPSIAVGLIDARPEFDLELQVPYRMTTGAELPTGRYRVGCGSGAVVLQGPLATTAAEIAMRPAGEGGFLVETTIGIDFHWQQQQQLTFCGEIRLLPTAGGVVLINDVELETYLASVICSEMSSSSPLELLRAHAIVSRSWLLAQLTPPVPSVSPPAQTAPGEHIRWYDRENHTLYDVCADDHCQRYQGVGRIAGSTAAAAVADTRGLVLQQGHDVCDARFYKCCGGVTEAFSAAWQDIVLPYLQPVRDAEEARLPEPSLATEAGMRRFIEHPPPSYCSERDPLILGAVLPDFDKATVDYYRWQVRCTTDELSKLVEQKLAAGLGRLTALEPVERGLSGRLTRLRLVGEAGQLVVGKELEIRRALSPSHLYSSAFVIDVEGPRGRPEVFILRGAGWGHGVGMCQIGAAVMASRGSSYQEILAHYYPGADVSQRYC